jgi:hypothetical protein
VLRDLFGLLRLFITYSGSTCKRIKLKFKKETQNNQNNNLPNSKVFSRQHFNKTRVEGLIFYVRNLFELALLEGFHLELGRSVFG